VIAIPTIHVLNVFRNAGIVWLTDTYRGWSLSGMGIFDFAHSYAAKVASLFAMFLMAIALFDLLPELHRHVMKVLNPVIHVTRIISGVLASGLVLARRLRRFWT